MAADVKRPAWWPPRTPDPATSSRVGVSLSGADGHHVVIARLTIAQDLMTARDGWVFALAKGQRLRRVACRQPGNGRIRCDDAQFA